jgi:hypothetical protein
MWVTLLQAPGTCGPMTPSRQHSRCNGRNKPSAIDQCPWTGHAPRRAARAVGKWCRQKRCYAAAGTCVIEFRQACRGDVNAAAWLSLTSNACGSSLGSKSRSGCAAVRAPRPVIFIGEKAARKSRCGTVVGVFRLQCKRCLPDRIGQDAPQCNTPTLEGGFV